MYLGSHCELKHQITTNIYIRLLNNLCEAGIDVGLNCRGCEIFTTGVEIFRDLNQMFKLLIPEVVQSFKKKWFQKQVFSGFKLTQELCLGIDLGRHSSILIRKCWGLNFRKLWFVNGSGMKLHLKLQQVKSENSVEPLLLKIVFLCEGNERALLT